MVTSFNANDVLRVQWINNERLLLAAGDAQEETGLARFSGWYAVNRDGSEGRQLTRGQMEFLGLPAGAGSDVFIASAGRTRYSADVYRLNTKTDRTALLSFDTGHRRSGQGWRAIQVVSPLYHADKLNAPVLLAYGASDQRVPLKHGNAFRAALDKNGKTYEWVVYSEEGHGFNKDENRFDFYRRVDSFMKKYLQ